MLDVYVDADACPVKDEVVRVARRHDLRVVLVSNSWMRTPEAGRIELVVVGQGLDEADDWIATHVAAGDIVITSDIPLAARCLAAGARVLGPKGDAFSRETIGHALARREILARLREDGAITGGPAPMQPRDRSAFLGRLEEIVQAVRRGA